MTPEEIKLKDMMKQVQDKKEKTAELRGRKTQLLKQLEAEGCETVEDAEKIIAQEEKKIQKAQIQLEKEMKKLEEDFVWA